MQTENFYKYEQRCPSDLSTNKFRIFPLILHSPHQFLNYAEYTEYCIKYQPTTESLGASVSTKLQTIHTTSFKHMVSSKLRFKHLFY